MIFIYVVSILANLAVLRMLWLGRPANNPDGYYVDSYRFYKEPLDD